MPLKKIRSWIATKEYNVANMFFLEIHFILSLFIF
jgi:hypothetical protein